MLETNYIYIYIKVIAYYLVKEFLFQIQPPVTFLEQVTEKFLEKEKQKVRKSHQMEHVELGT